MVVSSVSIHVFMRLRDPQHGRLGLESDHPTTLTARFKFPMRVVTDGHQDAKEHKNGVIKTTPKKRGAAKNDDESPVAKKKRTTAKMKKEAKDAEDNADAAGGNLPLTPPVTPPKKGRGRKASNTANADVKRSVPKPKGGKKIKATESAEDSAEGPNSQESPTTTKLGTPRKRAAVTKDKAVARGLPTSMEQASDADKMLLHMKDVENKPWAEIRKMWKVMTSQETASSTLPNRYNRLKANLMVLKDGDVSVLRTFLAYPLNLSYLILNSILYSNMILHLLLLRTLLGFTPSFQSFPSSQSAIFPPFFNLLLLSFPHHASLIPSLLPTFHLPPTF